MEPFVPKSRELKPKRRHVADAEYLMIKAAAEATGVSIKSFTRQAVFYAMANMKTESES